MGPMKLLLLYLALDPQFAQQSSFVQGTSISISFLVNYNKCGDFFNPYRQS